MIRIICQTFYESKGGNLGKRICFVSPHSYPLLAERCTGFIGGAEVLQIILAKELIKHGFEISFITYGNSGTPVEHLDGIKIFKVYPAEEASHLNLPLKIWHFLKAMRHADAHIYFHESGAYGIVSLFCRLARKKFIRYIASDADVDKSQCLSFRQRFGDWLDFKLANIVIVQTEHQKKMLADSFGRKGLVIKNAFPILERKIVRRSNKSTVLWVAMIKDVKQPEIFLKLAQAVPEGSFQMIGGEGDNPQLYNKIAEASAAIPNLEFVGFVPFNEVNRYFEQALILVNTSEYEGFSNTFIQAWQQYVPVVSLNADPDGIIGKYKLGFHSKTFNQLVDDVKTLLGDEQLREEMGRNGRQYVEREHDLSNVAKRYVEVFNRL